MRDKFADSVERKMFGYVIIFTSIVITIHHCTIVRDLQDTYNGQICPESRPTIGRDLKNILPQQCMCNKDMVNNSEKIKSFIIYENRRMTVKGRVKMTLLYNSFEEKWEKTRTFEIIESKILLKLTPYTQGM